MPYKFPIRYGKYLLTKRIAVGGMAEVFRAKLLGPRGFEKVLAIKRILPEFGEDEDFVTMFVDEARISSSLHHNNIVQVFDFGQVNNSYYLAMEYVDGTNLRNLYQRALKQNAPFPPHLASFICLQVAKALEYAHNVSLENEQNIFLVHRDISPQNVLISREGDVKLTDFGIAKATIKLSKTQPGKVQGKLSYMSPEQALGKKIDLRSDIFSLGIIFYELLSGTKLYSGENTGEKYSKIRYARIENIKTHYPDISDELHQLVHAMLERLPENRPSSASQIVQSLDKMLANYSNEALEQELRDLLSGLFPQEKSDSHAFSSLPADVSQSEKEAPEQGGTEVRASFIDSEAEKGPPPKKEEHTLHTREISAQPSIHLWTRFYGKLQRKYVYWGLGLLTGLLLAYWGTHALFLEKQSASSLDAPLPSFPSSSGDNRMDSAVDNSDSLPVDENDESGYDENISLSDGPLDLDLKEQALYRQLEVEEKLKKLEEEVLEAKREAEESKEKLKETEEKLLQAEKSKPAAKPAVKKCPQGMAKVPANQAWIGSHAEDPDRNDLLEPKLHRVSLSHFCIDRYEYPNRKAQLPLTNISWGQAQNECKKAGKRLCSANEWEAACKNLSRGDRFVSGSDLAPSQCNVRESNFEQGTLATAGTFSTCRSSHGIYDLNGNAEEWTSTAGNYAQQTRLVKGGSHKRPKYESRCASLREIPEGDQSDDLGFRCCKSL